MPKKSDNVKSTKDKDTNKPTKKNTDISNVKKPVKSKTEVSVKDVQENEKNISVNDKVENIKKVESVVEPVEKDTLVDVPVKEVNSKNNIPSVTESEEVPNKGLKVFILLAIIALLVFLGANVNATSKKDSTKPAANAVVGTYNNVKIKVSDITNVEGKTVSAEEVLDYARKQVIIQEMDAKKVPVVSDDELEAAKTEYLGESDWKETAEAQGMTVEALKAELKFVVRLNSFRDDFLGVTKPVAPNNSSDEAANSAYENAVMEYQTKLQENNAKWMNELNRIFGTAKVTLSNIKVSTE